MHFARIGELDRHNVEQCRHRHQGEQRQMLIERNNAVGQQRPVADCRRVELDEDRLGCAKGPQQLTYDNQVLDLHHRRFDQRSHLLVQLE